MAAFAPTLAAILLFAGLSLSSASAIGPDPLSGSLVPSLNPSVTPIGPSSAPQASIEAAANVCAIHTWLDPDGGVVRVRMIQGSSVITSPTWIGVLDFGGGDIAYAYCTDIAHHAAGSRPYCLDPGFFSDWRVSWFVTTYPPTPTDRVQQAARQAALWHLTDGAMLDASNATLGDAALDSAVLNAYNALLASIPAAPPPSFQPGNVEIVVDPGSDLNLLPGGETHPFTVRLTKGGLPLAGYAVQVTATLGSLSAFNGVTDGNGEAQFTLTSAISGAAFITVTAEVTLPAGSRFLDQVEPSDKQRLVLAQNKTVIIEGYGNKTWLTVPNGIVVRKFNDRNGNGVQDHNEPNLAGWRFVLNTPDGATYNRTTGADGNAYFDNLVPAALYGVFTVTEVLQTNWINVTPLVVTRTRSLQDPWTQWVIGYANAQLSQLKVLKYLDLNLNGQRDPGEPGLAGWQFEIRRWDGNDFIAFLGGTTDDTGHLRFNNLAPGLYKIIEFGQVGYTNTTPLERIVEILPNSPGIYEVTFGNARNGSLVVVKAVNWSGVTPSPTQTFTLCITGPSYPGGNCQTIGPDGGSLMWTSLLPGTYTITETEPGPAWSVTGNGVTVTLTGGGGLFTGTITNTRTTPQLGSLQIIKSVNWIGATPDPNQTFEICITGPSYPAGDCQNIGANGGPLTWNNLIPGVYTVTETSPGSAWSVIGSGVAVIAPPGGAGSATITNTLRYGSLIITKTVDWKGFTPDPTMSFDLCISGPSYPTTPDCQNIGANGGVLTWNNLIPGDYIVTEPNAGGQWSVTISDSVVTVGGGSSAGVSALNTYAAGRLVVTKTVDWSGTLVDPNQTFEICVTGPSFPSGDCQTVGPNGGSPVWDNLIPGVYTVTESNPGPAWVVTGDNVTVNVPDGGTGSTTIVNTRRVGSLQISKIADWNGIAPDPAQTFTICVTGPSYPSGDCQTIDADGGVLTWNNLIPGVYTVTETDPGVAWSITGSNVTVTVTGDGANTHTITNTRRLGSLQVTKVVNWNGITPDPAQTFTICITGPSYPAGDCQSIGANGGALTWNNLIPGNYAVTEPNAGNLWNVAITGSPVTVPIDGGSGSATVTNTRLLPGLVARKSSIPPNGTQVGRGSLITYVLVLTNTGQIALTNVRLTDTAPLGTEYIAGSAVPAPANPPLPLVWVVPTLNVGDSFTARFTVRVTPVTGTLAITNSATVSSDQTPITETNVVVHPFRETAIDLLSFTATPQPNNTILVRWVTGAEINTYGFHLFRSADGSRANAVQITDQIILSQGWGQGGATYQWIDANVQTGVTYTYWLQETELDGDLLEYGPVSASLDQLSMVRRLYLPITRR